MRNVLRIALTFIPLALIGCGGSGSAVDSGALSGAGGSVGTAYNGPNKGMLSLFVMNSSGDNYDHAWVVLKKIDLKLAAGGARTIYDDEQGIGLDLASLRDPTNPIHQFLNGVVVPVGTYTGVDITVGNQATFFPSRSEKIMGANFPSKDQKGNSVISMDFEAPKILGNGAENFVLDFNLGEWQSKDEKLDPKLKVANGDDVKAANFAIPTLLQGQVLDLKGKSPDLAFMISPEKDVNIPVHTSASSVLRNLGPKSKLKNGAWIEINGRFDASAHRFEATLVTVAEQRDQLSQAAVQGVVTSADEHSGKIEIEPAATRGFAPASVKISLTAKSATFCDGAGRTLDRAAFYRALSQGKGVELLARGSFDPKQQSFAATDAALTSPAKTAPEVKDPKLLKA